MLFEQMFERFCDLSPLTVMARMTLEHALAPDLVNAIFERSADEQYTRTLTLSTLVDLMAPVTCGTMKSVRASYLKSAAEIGVSLTAVYDKLQGVETSVTEALVRETAARLATVIDEMGGRRTAPLAA